jgi:anti-anti-sigma regulatory factor
MEHAATPPDCAPDPLHTAFQQGVNFRHVRAHLDDDSLVLTVTAPQLLDDVLADGFYQELAAAVTQAGARNVVFDMHAVIAICSGCMEPLLALRKLLAEQGGRLALCGLSPLVLEVFHLAELADSTAGEGSGFRIEPDVPSALTAVR